LFFLTLYSSVSDAPEHPVKPYKNAVSTINESKIRFFVNNVSPFYFFEN